MPVDFTYCLPMPAPSSGHQSCTTRRIHRNSITRTRTPSPSIPHDFISTKAGLRARCVTGSAKYRQKQNSTADDISRLLDPSYASFPSPSIVGPQFAPANNNSNGAFMYLDSQGELHDPDYRPFPVLRSSLPKAWTNRFVQPKASPTSPYDEEDWGDDDDDDDEKYSRGRQAGRKKLQSSSGPKSSDTSVKGVIPPTQTPESKSYSYLSVSRSVRSSSPNSRWSECIPSLDSSATDTGPFYGASLLQTPSLCLPLGTKSPLSGPDSLLTADKLSPRDDISSQQSPASLFPPTLSPQGLESPIFAAERTLVASERAFAALSALSAGDAGDKATAKISKARVKKEQAGLRDASAAQDKEAKATAKEDERVVQQDIRTMKGDVKAMANDDKTLAKDERAMVKHDRAVERDEETTEKEDAAVAKGGKPVKDKLRKDAQKLARSIANAAAHLKLGHSQDANRAQHVQLKSAQEHAALGVLKRAAQKVQQDSTTPPPSPSTFWGNTHAPAWTGSLAKRFHSPKEEDAPEPSMFPSGHYANEPRTIPVLPHIPETPAANTPRSATHARLTPFRDQSTPRQYRAVKQRVRFMAFRMKKRVDSLSN